jgi:hypothetical protein
MRQHVRVFSTLFFSIIFLSITRVRVNNERPVSPHVKLAGLSESLPYSLFLNLDIGVFFTPVFHLWSLGRSYTVRLNDILALRMVLIAHRYCGA